MNTGFFTLGTYKEIPIRIHWTLPILAVFFGGFRWAPGIWIGVFLLILLHELGHAFVVRRFGHRVTGIDVSGFGGLCHWSGLATSIQRAAIAWGGVWAQMVVLAVTLLVTAFTGRPSSTLASQLVYCFTYTNLFIMFLNLIPIRPLDGAEAWGLFPLLYKDWKGKRSIRQEIDRLSKKDDKPAKSTGPKKAEAPSAAQRGDPAKNEVIFKKMMGELLDLPDQLSTTQKDRDPDKN